MYCSNMFCIYSRNNKCILDEVSIDEIGICQDLILVDIPDQTLQRYKDKQLIRLEKDYN